jgi:ABC-type bacteriocin/lantibiotic exporter with double-glycine peptidase domain
MKMLTVAGLMITLPAIAVILFMLFSGNPLWTLGALASFAVNSLPFIAGIYLIRRARQNGQTFEEEH